MTDPRYVVTRPSESALVVKTDQLRQGWEQWFLFVFDAHWDNPHADRALLKLHHEQAMQRGAGIFYGGDFFCAMQGKFDPRHVKADIRPEHQGSNYLDLLVDTATDWLQPYKANIIGMGEGNHELGIEKRLETSLTGRLCANLGVQHMHEWGFIRFQFSRPAGNRTSRNLYWHHGSGGGGPVTRGVIASARRNAMLDSTDLVVTGHIHEQWMLKTPVVRVTDSGQVEIRDRLHLQCGTYKQEFIETGYHVSNQRPPKPLGGVWVRFFYDGRARDSIGVQASFTD